MQKYIFLFLFLLGLTSCRRFAENEMRYDERVMMQFDTDDFSQVVWDYVTELKYDHRLHIENAMVCFDGDSKIRLQFSTQLILELCEARDLLVTVAEGLLDRVNHSKALSEYLNPYPLTADQLEIYIDFQSFYGIYDDPFYIGWVVLEEGMSYFYAFNLKDKRLNTHQYRFDFWNSRIEPYFKSRSFVYAQREAERKYKESHPLPAPTSLLPERFIPPNAPVRGRVPYYF